MDITRGDTLSGYVISVTEGNNTLNLYGNDATFTDGNGEIIVDGLPEYDIETVTDAEAFEFFGFATNYFDSLRAYMENLEQE